MNNSPQAQPGSLYGVPGVTQRFEQNDTTLGDVLLLNKTSQVNWNTAVNFQQTDVVHWWELDTEWVNTFTTGTGATAVLSPYAPYNLIQDMAIQMQGQYKPVNLQSGADAAIFQYYRPMRAQVGGQPVLGAAPQNAVNAANPAFFDSNVVATPTMTATTTPVHLYLELPCSLWFDQYWDLGEDGSVQAPPIATYVSPQYMSGGQRVVKPSFKYAAGIPANKDAGPVFVSGGTLSAFTSNATQTFRRVGVYSQTNPAAMPPVFNWQYQRHSFQYSVAGKTKFTIPITDYGQVLSVWVRFFDPTANAPIVASTFTKGQLLYGSNLPRFDDTQKSMQERFVMQHDIVNPVGTWIWDMALTDTGGYITNAKAINTLTNANVNAYFETGSPLSSTAYAVVGIESLVYVAIQ